MSAGLGAHDDGHRRVALAFARCPEEALASEGWGLFTVSPQMLRGLASFPAGRRCCGGADAAGVTVQITPFPGTSRRERCPASTKRLRAPCTARSDRLHLVSRSSRWSPFFRCFTAIQVTPSSFAASANASSTILSDGAMSNFQTAVMIAMLMRPSQTGRRCPR